MCSVSVYAHRMVAELLARTCFSLLDGASQPHELVQAAVAGGVRHLGICDRDGVYGLVQAHQAAVDGGLHLICGATLTLDGLPSVVVHCVDRSGWASLCHLLTLGRAEQPKGWSKLSLAALCEHHRGLMCTLRPGWSAREAAPLREAFGERLSVALSRDLTPADPHRTAAARAVAEALDARMVATNDVRFHVPERRVLADVLTCIRRRTTLKAAGRSLLPNAERGLLAEVDFRARYAAWPDAIRAAVEVAERCTFSLSELKYGYPREVVPEGSTPMGWLREITERGLRWRYPDVVPDKVRAAVEHELQVVEELDFPSYFLTVYDIVRFARSQGILCQGRGSAANSAICYALGVTSVDPAHHELLFERFISRERGEPPDIDVDFEHERREEVIQYVYARYGRDRAAMVNEFITYRQRSAIREVGKVFGLSLDQVDRLAKTLDRWSAGLETPRDDQVAAGRVSEKWSQPHEGGRVGAFAPAADDVAELVREAGLDPASDPIRGTLQLSAELAGFPRHLSIHVGGFVIAAHALDELVPIEPATMEGRTVLQWDKYDVEALDFVKVDVLGLGMLTAIRKAFDLIEGVGGPELDLATVPAEDPEVYEMFCRADTVGVFQIESRAQMSMLPRLQPRCFYDLVVEVAIVRPGPIQGGMVHPYLRRRDKTDPITYAHPALVPILERTLGVPLFQEQVMAMAVAVGGFSAGEADRLRRAMGAWRKRGNLSEMGRRLVAGMTERGIAKDYAEAVYAQILGFGEYGFPESHAASFALLVYVSGWIKRHHPAAFAAALINSQPMGFYSPRAILADAQRHGVEVRPVCLVRSVWDCTLEEGPAGPAIRCGLRLVRGLGEEHAQAIELAREERPFRSVVDAASRSGLDRGRLQTLADAGAFDALGGGDRRRVAWTLQGLWTDLPLFAGIARSEPEPELRPQSVLDRLHADYRSTGLSVDLHPIALIREELDRIGVAAIEALPRTDNDRRLKVAGLVSNRQRPGTANGVVFMTLEDETGLANLVIWPKTWQAFRRLARTARLLGAEGKVQRQGDAVSLLVERFFELPDPPEAARRPLGELPVRSRDFH
ncbi:MAG: DNA polymerase III subunit alpha [Alphaproteobacteria bacterium]|nr:DNA polymerase III subunit alpha [Alphaproteobacteria bacterium]MCB9695339.1 DNA polymerase III subunit alpha [Alphaproteobacteria bacterium]